MMKITHTTMSTSQLWVFIQSRTRDIAAAARWWNSGKNSSGRAATSTVAAMKGSASAKFA